MELLVDGRLNTFVVPPSDVDVSLVVTMYNDSFRRSMVEVEYLEIGTIEDLIFLAEKYKEAGTLNGGFISNKYDAYQHAHLYIDNEGYVPLILVSGTTEDILSR